MMQRVFKRHYRLCPIVVPEFTRLRTHPATVLAIYKKVGQRVYFQDTVATLEIPTENATLDVQSDCDGRVLAVNYGPGDKVYPGDHLMVVDPNDNAFRTRVFPWPLAPAVERLCPRLALE